MFRNTKIKELYFTKDIFPSLTTDGTDDTKVAYMFADTPLETINFDLTNITYAYSMFYNCTSLKTCTGATFKNYGYYKTQRLCQFT